MSNRNSATTTTIETSDLELECALLREFKNFLKDQVANVGANGVVGASAGAGGVVELKNCVTRASTETYSVNLEELHAEILMSIWLQFQTKHCPYHFQLPLLRTASAELEQQCRNAKDSDLTFVTTTNTKQMQTSNDNVAGTQFDLVKLQKFTVNYLGKFFTRLNDNIEAGNLKNYAESDVTICDGANCNCTATTIDNDKKLTYAVHCIKNKHRKMEDRHVCLERFSDLYQLKQRYSLYAVFDGHSGALAATYATTQLPYLLAEQLKHLPNANNCSNESSATVESIDAYRDAFETAFLSADAKFVRKQITSGTTAVCALISYQNDKPTHLYVAWVGDSQALLVGATARLQLVKPHKPDIPDERKRIELSAGDGDDCGIGGGVGVGVGVGGCAGAVMFVQGQWRVNGILNVSRSIGDHTVNAVIAEPDFVDVELTKSHDFLVIGTDGLWDHVDEATIVQTIYGALLDDDKKFEDIPKLLIELAKENDSQDNITVVIVLLKARAQIVDNYKKQQK